MVKGWLTKAGPYRVEHVQFEDAGPLLAEAYAVPRGVQHTTEGTTIEGALSAYKAKRCAATFTLGRDAKHQARILQHVPLGFAARALLNEAGGVETNRIVIAQIELVSVSPPKQGWLPDDEVVGLLAALYWQLRRSCGIPLARVANPSRSMQTWRAHAGWYGHVDVPENDHVDPRLLNYARLFDRAHKLDLPAVQGKLKAKPRKLTRPSVVLVKRRAKKTPPAVLCGIPGRFQ